MKSIEDRFQDLVGRIVDCELIGIPANEKEIVDRFYALWYMRARHRRLELQEIQLHGVAGETLSLEQEENLEANHYLWVRADGKMPARQLNGLHLQQEIDGYCRNLSHITGWGIVRPILGEFIVPDTALATIIPLTPQLALTAFAGDGFVTMENLAEVNRFMVDNSQEYYFARDLDACPLSPANTANDLRPAPSNDCA